MADKQIILRFLVQSELWTSPAQIRAAITEVPERTLRRWLSELVKEGLIERAGNRRGSRYRRRAKLDHR